MTSYIASSSSLTTPPDEGQESGSAKGKEAMKPSEFLEGQPSPSHSAVSSAGVDTQCIVCLTKLPEHGPSEDGEEVATLVPCSHTLHNACLAPWIEKSNSCPLCRASFNTVNVSMFLEGPITSNYEVEDRRFKFEDTEHPAPYTSTLCPLCQQEDEQRMEVLCDGCMVYYHADCVGLEKLPEFTWFCYSCERSAPRRLRYRTEDDDEDDEEEDEDDEDTTSGGGSRPRRPSRLARAQARLDDWARAWQSVSEDSYEYGYTQRSRGQWNRRAAIAQAQGVLDIFNETFPYLLHPHRPREYGSEEPPEETEEQKSAWRAMEEAKELEQAGGGPSSSSQETVKPSELPAKEEQEKEQEDPNGQEHQELQETQEPQEPKRTYKRPRTRRDSEFGHAPPEKKAKIEEEIRQANETPGPSIFRTLLEKVERAKSPALSLGKLDASSPRHVEYNSDSGPTSPASTAGGWLNQAQRAVSATPSSPRSRSPAARSPTYSPNYATSPTATGLLSPTYRPIVPVQPIQAIHPVQVVHSPRSEAMPSSPSSYIQSPAHTSASSLPLEVKQDIQTIVRGYLKPYYRAGLSADRFMEVNRLVSRKLYELVPQFGAPDANNEEANRKWQEKAAIEVKQILGEVPVVNSVAVSSPTPP